MYQTPDTRRAVRWQCHSASAVPWQSCGSAIVPWECQHATAAPWQCHRAMAVPWCHGGDISASSIVPLPCHIATAVHMYMFVFVYMYMNIHVHMYRWVLKTLAKSPHPFASASVDVIWLASRTEYDREYNMILYLRPSVCVVFIIWGVIFIFIFCVFLSPGAFCICKRCWNLACIWEEV